jgi:GxxExxY protein
MQYLEPLPERAQLAAKDVVDAAYQVHQALGPGLLENIYEVCLCHELNKRGLLFQKQASFSIVYDNMRLDAGLRVDLLVEESLIVELKSVETLLPLHEAQLLTYLKLSGKRLGLLINFNVPLIKGGIRRVVL